MCRCALGYYGNPLRLGGKCLPCNCGNNGQLGSCDPLTGGKNNYSYIRCDVCYRECHENVDGGLIMWPVMVTSIFIMFFFIIILNYHISQMLYMHHSLQITPLAALMKKACCLQNSIAKANSYTQNWKSLKCYSSLTFILISFDGQLL